MKAFVTAVNEPTTDLCIWALSRNGFKPQLVLNNQSLWSKLRFIYEHANEDFLRVDADIIVNQNMTPEFLTALGANETVWWWQFMTYDWYKQDLNHALSFIKREALPALRANIMAKEGKLRPETEMSRIKEFYEPRRFESYEKAIMGLHGYGIKDLEPVKKLKDVRNQSYLYDFELAERLNALRIY